MTLQIRKKDDVERFLEQYVRGKTAVEGFKVHLPSLDRTVTLFEKNQRVAYKLPVGKGHSYYTYFLYNHVDLLFSNRKEINKALRERKDY